MSMGGRLVLALVLTLGCENAPTGDPDGGPALAPLCGDDRCVYVVGALRVPREGDPIPGLDLDDRVSDDTDEVGCGHPDFVAPDGREGIDNQFTTLVGTLEAALGESADDALQASIAGGDSLFFVAFESGTSAWRMQSGPAEPVGELALEPSGEPSGGQTFVRSEVAHSAEASTLGGVVEAPLGDVSVRFAFTDAPTDLVVREGRLRVLFVDGQPTTGTLAGRLRVDDLLATIPPPTGGPIDPTPGRTTLEEHADLDPDGEGVCQSISIAFAMDLVPAELAP